MATQIAIKSPFNRKSNNIDVNIILLLFLSLCLSAQCAMKSNEYHPQSMVVKCNKWLNQIALFVIYFESDCLTNTFARTVVPDSDKNRQHIWHTHSHISQEENAYEWSKTEQERKKKDKIKRMMKIGKAIILMR